MTRLDPYITAVHRTKIGYPPLPDAPNWLADFRADATLATEARDEVLQLSAVGRTGRQVSAANGGCHESRVRHDTLVWMLERLDAAPVEQAPDRDSETQRKPATEDEIEITDEMVDAGAKALLFTDRRYETDEGIAIRVYEAMRKLDTAP